jgi:GNAT superfamily N-acetyltransferase
MAYDNCDNMPEEHRMEKPQNQSAFSLRETEVQIRNMRRADLDQVGEILFKAFNTCALKYGYAPQMQSVQEGASWAWVMLRHGPSELLIAEVENRAVGICCLNPRGNHGGVGPVAVDPSFQKYGIGRRMMNVLVNRAEGLQSIRVFQDAFNPVSFSLYYSFNFLPVVDLLNLFLDTGDLNGADLCRDVTELTMGDIDAVYTYDVSRSKLTRRTDLEYYVQWGKVFVYRSKSQIRGFLACLPGSQSVQLGPLVAEGEDEAICLFQHALEVFKQRPCQTRVMARDYLLVRTLKKLGFKLYCLNILMVRGLWRPSQYIEAFGRFPEAA